MVFPVGIISIAVAKDAAKANKERKETFNAVSKKNVIIAQSIKPDNEFFIEGIRYDHPYLLDVLMRHKKNEDFELCRYICGMFGLERLPYDEWDETLEHFNFVGFGET